MCKWQQISLAGNRLAQNVIGGAVYRIPNICMKRDIFHQDSTYCLPKRCFQIPWCQVIWGFPDGTRGKEPACQCRRPKTQGFYPWVGKIPWRRAQQSPPVFLPGETHGQQALVHRVTKSRTRLQWLSTAQQGTCGHTSGWELRVSSVHPGSPRCPVL